MQTCRCCRREFTEWDADWVEVDPSTYDTLILVAPTDELCRSCSDPEDHPITHSMAHEEDEE